MNETSNQSAFIQSNKNTIHIIQSKHYLPIKILLKKHGSPWLNSKVTMFKKNRPVYKIFF